MSAIRLAFLVVVLVAMGAAQLQPLPVDSLLSEKLCIFFINTVVFNLFH